MQGLLLAFQDFWRENAGIYAPPFGYAESYSHIVLQAFLQRVINGGGEIIREMALGKGALDLGILLRGGKYAVEVKLRYNYERAGTDPKIRRCLRGIVDDLFGEMDLSGVTGLVGVGNALVRNPALRQAVEERAGMSCLIPDIAEMAAYGVAQLASRTTGHRGRGWFGRSSTILPGGW